MGGQKKNRRGWGGGHIPVLRTKCRAAALWCLQLQCMQQFTTHHAYFAPVTRKSIVYNGSMLEMPTLAQNSLLRPFAPCTRQGNLPTILLGQVTGASCYLGVACNTSPSTNQFNNKDVILVLFIQCTSSWLANPFRTNISALLLVPIPFIIGPSMF